MKFLNLDNKVLKDYFLTQFGISVDIRLIDNKKAIIIDNHLSLFKIIENIKNDYSFEIYHENSTTYYILYLKY